MVHPQDRDMVEQNYISRLDGKPAPTNYAFRCLQKNGGIRWLELSAEQISWEGQPATLNFLRDVTEKHLLEEELVKAQKEVYITEAVDSRIAINHFIRQTLRNHPELA